jgi:hypothetical protein
VEMFMDYNWTFSFERLGQYKSCSNGIFLS